MSHVDSGPLATYSSLQDKHLVGYFNNTRMKKHLRRAGLVTRRGELVTESTYRLNMARKEHQRHVRDLMAQAIVHKTLDLERQRQADIKQKLEEIAKVEMVRRVRMDRARKGDEDITQYLSPRGRPKSAHTNQSRQPQPPRGGGRPSTAPARHRPTSKRAGVVYVDQDGFPVHRESARSDRSDTSSNGEVDSPALRELDPKILHRISLNLRPDEKEGLSPYSPDVTPRPPGARSKGQRSPRTKPGGVVSKNGRGYRPRSNRGSLALHRKEPAYPHATQLQSMCDVTVRYRGTGLKLQYEREDKRDEIQIYQQHCGGENLVVFQGFAEKGNDLIFVSRRHRGYPFSVTFFVNRVQVLRLSACCEYKYTPGALLGGSKGHFKFIGVHGSSPCYKCLVEAELARRERQRYKDVQTDTVEPEPEPEPELAGMSTQTEAQEQEEEEGKKEESTQMEEEEEANCYDDDEFEDDEDQKDQREEKEEENQSYAKDNESDGFSSEVESEKGSAQAQDMKPEDNYSDSDFEVESEKEVKEKEEDVAEEVAEELGDEGVQSGVEEEKEVEEEKAEEEEKEEEEVGEEKYSSDSDQKKNDIEEVEDEFEQDTQEEVEAMPEEKEDEHEVEKEDERSLFSASEGENRLLSSDDDDDDRKSLVEDEKKDSESEADFKISSSGDEDEKEEAVERQTEKDLDNGKVEDAREEATQVKEEEEESDKGVGQSAKDETEEREEVLEESFTHKVTIEAEVEHPPREAVLIKETALVRANNEDAASLAEEQVLDKDPVEEQELKDERDQEDSEEKNEKVNPTYDVAGSVEEDNQSTKEDDPAQSDVEPDRDHTEQKEADEGEDDQDMYKDASDAEHEEEEEAQQTTYSAQGQEHTKSADEAKNDREDPRPEEEEGRNLEQDNVLDREEEEEKVEQSEETHADVPTEPQKEDDPHDDVVKDEAVATAASPSQEPEGDKAQQEKPPVDTPHAPAEEQAYPDAQSEQVAVQEPEKEKEEEEKTDDAQENKEETENQEKEQDETETIKEKEEDEKKDEEKEQKEDEYKSDSSSSSSSSSLDSEDEEKQKLKLSGFIQEQATDSKPDNIGLPTQSLSNNNEISPENDQSYSRLALNMNEKNLGTEQAQQVAQALLEDPKYKSIEYLLLRANPIEDKGISSIMQSLITLHHQIPDATKETEEHPKTGIKLTHLDLGDTKITDKGAKDVAEFLKLPTNITNINLSDNSLGRAGCKALADGLRSNKSLWTLSIEYAGLGDSGCREIIEAVRDHPSLRELNLEGNAITDESARALLQLVKDNSVLTSINFVRDNQVTQELGEEIEEILKTGEFIW